MAVSFGHGAVMKIGSDEHKQRFCNAFIASHCRFSPESLAWPDLDAAALERLRGIPFWQEVLYTERRAGAIVNNASVIGWRAQAGQAHYAAAKAGVMALTRCAAIEAAPAGVRVNAVAPSLAMHPFLSKVTTDEVLDELTRREAFGRAAEPWEVANVIVFLASDYASYMTGEVVSVSSQHP